jgi:amino acid transporter
MEKVGGGLIGIGIIIFLIILVVKITLTLLLFAVGIFVMAIIPAAVGWVAYQTYLAFTKRDFNPGKSLLFVLLTVATGITLSTATFLNSSPEALFLLFVSGSSLVSSLAYPYVKRRQLIKKYQEEEKYLIEP